MISIQELRGAVTLSEGASYEALRDTVIRMWETATGRKWNRRVNHVERRYGENCQMLLLELWPIETITSVEIRVQGSSTYTTLDVSEYLLDGNRSLERHGRVWPHIVRITYTGGYTEAPTVGQYQTPAEVAKALLVQAQFMSNRLTSANVHLKSQGFQGGSSTFFEDATLHPLFKDLADRLARKS